MSDSLRNFIDLWHSTMWYGAIVFFAIAILVLIIYYIRYAGNNELKDKYDFASLNEIKSHRTMHILIAIAIGMFLNTLRPDLIDKGFILFFVRLSITIVAATIYGYVASLVMKFYYPTKLSKKLNRLRYTPRIHEASGNQMKLLSEEEEDAYLDEGQQAEEDAFSVDYDVWIEAESGDTKIEKYMGYLTALECDRCGFHTLRVEKEEIEKVATDEEDGELVTHYKCSYCNRIKRQSKIIGRKGGGSDTGTDEPEFVEQIATASAVTHIHVEIHGSNGEVLNYEFQTTHQAETFLREFDFSKVEE